MNYSDKFIVLQEKESNKINFFTINDSNYLEPYFNDDELLMFKKPLIWFDGIELMLNDKYNIVESSKERLNELNVSLLDLKQYNYEISSNGDMIYYRKSGKTYIQIDLVKYKYLVDYTLILKPFIKELGDLKFEGYYYMAELYIGVTFRYKYNMKIKDTDIL